MKYKSVHKVVVTILSLLVMVCTVSLTIEKHFCGEVLVDVAVFSETKKCTNSCLNHDNTTLTKTSCCKNEVSIFGGISELATTSFDDVETPQQIRSIGTYTYKNNFDGAPKRPRFPKYYDPPILVKNIHVLDEVYLI